MGSKSISFTCCTGPFVLFLIAAACVSGSTQPQVVSKALGGEFLHHTAAPALNPGDTIRYDDGTPSYGLWLPRQDVYWAMRFTPARACTVKEAHCYIWIYSGDAPVCTLIIWDDNSGEPGNRVFSTTFTASGTSWNHVDITSRVAYAESTDFWIGYFLEAPLGSDTALAAVDSGIDYDDRNGIGVSGVWYTMSDLGGEGDLIIRAFVEYVGGTAAEDRSNLHSPGGLRLQQNTPNPFSRSTTVSYETPVSGEVNISVYDAKGRLVRSLAKAEIAPGYHSAIWNGRNNEGHELPDGVYFCKLSMGRLESTAKMVLIR
ncbi:MAG: FlgD immunoglobulin-like domain containing protein [bacterium]